MFFKPTFCPKNAQKSKSCSRLPEPQRDVPVCPNAKSCSKVAEHNWDRPTSQILGRPQANMTLWEFVRLHFEFARVSRECMKIHNTYVLNSIFDKNRNDSPCVHCVFASRAIWKPFYRRLRFFLLVQLKILKVDKKTFKQLVNGAPNDGFLPNTLNTLFRISRVLLDL